MGMEAQAKASAFAGELGEALLAWSDVEHVHTSIINPGTISVQLRRGGEETTLRVLLPTSLADVLEAMA